MRWGTHYAVEGCDGGNISGGDKSRPSDCRKRCVYPLAPSARGLRPQAVGERTVPLPERLQITARFSPSGPAGPPPSQREARRVAAAITYNVSPVSSFCKALARTLWDWTVMCMPSRGEQPAPGSVLASRNRTLAMSFSIGSSWAAMPAQRS